MIAPYNPFRSVRLVLWAVAVAFSVATGGLITWRSLSPPDPVTRVSGDALIVSRYSLVDQTGRAVTEKDYLGRWQLVFFGFTHCPDVCPTTLAYMSAALDELGHKADRVAPLFISVDPERDTPEVLSEYLAAIDPRLIGLTGSEAQVADAAGSFRVYSDRMDEAAVPVGYLMAHSGYIYLMNPEGRFDAVFLEGRETSEQFGEEILMRIEKEARN